MNQRVLLASGLIASSLLCASNSPAQPSVQTLAYQLTHVDQGEPFFSPDGKKVVYETTVAGFQQIFIMNADGTSPTQITHNAVTTTVRRGRPTERRLLSFPMTDSTKQSA